MFSQKAAPKRLLIETLCFHLLNLKGSILQLDAAKFVGHLWLGFWNLL